MHWLSVLSRIAPVAAMRRTPGMGSVRSIFSDAFGTISDLPLLPFAVHKIVRDHVADYHMGIFDAAHMRDGNLYV